MRATTKPDRSATIGYVLLIGLSFSWSSRSYPLCPLAIRLPASPSFFPPSLLRHTVFSVLRFSLSLSLSLSLPIPRRGGSRWFLGCFCRLSTDCFFPIFFFFLSGYRTLTVSPNSGALEFFGRGAGAPVRGVSYNIIGEISTVRCDTRACSGRDIERLAERL